MGWVLSELTETVRMLGATVHMLSCSVNPKNIEIHMARRYTTWIHKMRDFVPHYNSQIKKAQGLRAVAKSQL